jgi:diacylglycerol kinase (ATP)
VRVTLIYNPTSGDEDHDGPVLRSLLESPGHDVSSHSVKEDGWERLLSEHGELVVAAGGDGTVRKVFKELATSGADVTVLPLGSANNIASALGLVELDVEMLVANLENGKRMRYDLGEATAPWGISRFVESVGGGVFADVIARAAEADTEEGDKVEIGLRLLADVVRDAPARDWELEVDGVDVSGSYLAVEAMNIGLTGPNVPLAPEADPGDGKLDVVRIRPDDRAALLAYVEARLRGERPEARPLSVLLGSRISMQPPAGCLLRADDELWPEEGSPSGGDRVLVETGELAVSLLLPNARRA